jgi:hypothetical protein
VAIRRNARGRSLRLLLGDGCIDADMAVLAIGNLPPVPPFPLRKATGSSPTPERRAPWTLSGTAAQ